MRTIFHEYHLASTTYRFVVTSDPVRGHGLIKTVGSVVLTSAVGSEDTPFGPLVTGDEILVVKQEPRPNSLLRRLVGAKISDHQVNVDSAWNLSAVTGHPGWPFDFRQIRDGAAADDSAGWVNTGELFDKNVKIEVITLGATSVEFTIQGRGVGDAAVPVELLNGQFTTAVVPGTPASSAAGVFPIPETVASIRVGVKATGAAETATVSAYLLGRPHLR